ncbi:MAG: PHD finger domain-containing protein [Gaiella sp.]
MLKTRKGCVVLLGVETPVGSMRGGDRMRAPFGRRLRRVAIGLFFGSVATNAVLGISALVLGDFGETHSRLLGTSLAVTGALVLALACLPARERGLLGPLPLLGAVLGAGGFALVIVSIWTGGEDETLGKLIGTLMAPAAGAALACLLALPPLAARFRVVRTAAFLLLTTVVGLIVLALWIEPDTSWYARMIGVVGVLLAAATVSIPVLARVGRASADVIEAIAFCPYCGGEVLPAATVCCSSCGRSFSVHSGGGGRQS